MPKTTHSELLEFLITENVLLKMQINALQDLFAANYLSYGGYNPESFHNILVKPRQIENLRRILGCHRYLTDAQKIEILKSVTL